MAATWTSNLPEWKRRHDAACAFALIACAHVLINAVKRNYTAVGGGYIKGSQYQAAGLRTGQTMGSVIRTEPITEDGVKVIRVGILSDVTNTDGASIGLIALFWTLGHYSIYFRRHMRVDHWTPALLDSATEIRETFARVYAAKMAA